MKKILLCLILIVFIILTGCKKISTTESEYTFTEPEHIYESNLEDYAYYNKEVPNIPNSPVAPEFGYWWEDEMKNNPNWWKENYQVDDTHWQSDSYYAPVNNYVPNSEFTNGSIYRDNQYQYYRFHRLIFSVMPYEVRETEEILHCANFVYSYTWYVSEGMREADAPNIILPDVIQNKLESGYYIKDPTPQVYYLKNNYNILTPYMSGLYLNNGGYGHRADALRLSDDYPIYEQYREDIFSYIANLNIKFAGSNTQRAISSSKEHVYIGYENYGFCKSSKLTDDDINEIAESEFLVTFGDLRDLDKCNYSDNDFTGEYTCPSYLEAKIGSPLKVIPSQINPFIFSSWESKQYPLKTLVAEPFLQYMV